MPIIQHPSAPDTHWPFDAEFDRRLTEATQRYHCDERLCPEHLAKLRSSGLSYKAIVDSQAYTAADIEHLQHVLRWHWCFDDCISPSLVLPFHDLEGNQTDYAVVRPTRPRWRDGKPVKYEQPYGEGCRAYFPIDARAAITTPKFPLLITEGILKALAATQMGMPTIGLMGSWNWQVAKTKPRRLIDDLAHIDWHGRPVCIVFDGDPERNPNLLMAAGELAAVLQNTHGAKTRILFVPPKESRNGRFYKQGFDDFIVTFGAEYVRHWFAKRWEDCPPCHG